jgi:hypothetical protein
MLVSNLINLPSGLNEYTLILEIEHLLSYSVRNHL